jgi:hypothetical protein
MYFDDGQSPVSACAQFTDLSNSVNVARTAQLKNGVDGSITITLPDDVSFDQDELDRYTERIAKKYGGPENVGRVMVLQNGSQVNPLSTTPKDMGYSEGFQDSKAAVLATHGTPEVATGFAPPGAYAAYTMSMMAWRHAVIQPICDMLAESDTEHLADQFGEGITIEIESDEVDDVDQTEKRFTNDVQARIRTLNELRTLRGLPPYPGPEGDQLWPPTPQTAEPAMSGETGAEIGGGGNVAPFPKTPLGPQTKALRAAIAAAEDGDFEWLSSRLKSFDSSESRDDHGRWTGSGKRNLSQNASQAERYGVDEYSPEFDDEIGEPDASKIDAAVDQARDKWTQWYNQSGHEKYVEALASKFDLTPDQQKLLRYAKRDIVDELDEHNLDGHDSQELAKKTGPNMLRRLAYLTTTNRQEYNDVWGGRFGMKSLDDGQFVAVKSLGMSTSTGSDGGFTVPEGPHRCPHCDSLKTFNARGALMCGECWKSSDLPEETNEATNGTTNGHTNGVTV